jgi:hypothetical protein
LRQHITTDIIFSLLILVSISNRNVQSMSLPLILDYAYFTGGRNVVAGIRIDGGVVEPELSQNHRWLGMKIKSPAHITLMLCLFISLRKRLVLMFIICNYP